MGLELGGDHALAQAPGAAQLVQVQVGHLLRSEVGELALVDVRVLAEKVAGDGVLQEGVSDGLQPLEVDGIVAVAHGEGLQDEGGAGARVAGQLRLLVEAELNLGVDSWPRNDPWGLDGRGPDLVEVGGEAEIPEDQLLVRYRAAGPRSGAGPGLRDRLLHQLAGLGHRDQLVLADYGDLHPHHLLLHLLLATEAAWLPGRVPDHGRLLVPVPGHPLLPGSALVLALYGLGQVLPVELDPGAALPLHLAIAALLLPPLAVTVTDTEVWLVNKPMAYMFALLRLTKLSLACWRH